MTTARPGGRAAVGATPDSEERDRVEEQARLIAELRDALRRRDDRLAVVEARARLLEEEVRAAWRTAVSMPLRAHGRGD